MMCHPGIETGEPECGSRLRIQVPDSVAYPFHVGRFRVRLDSGSSRSADRRNDKVAIAWKEKKHVRTFALRY